MCNASTLVWWALILIAHVIFLRSMAPAAFVKTVADLGPKTAVLLIDHNEVKAIVNSDNESLKLWGSLSMVRPSLNTPSLSVCVSLGVRRLQADHDPNPV